MTADEQFMQRALQLARRGLGFTSPNPMVGAVIVARDGNIVGEGYHRVCGQAHAEVNAVNSVVDKSILRESTIYVTLEPCSHYGKTPPCAKLLVECGFKRVVIGMVDPNERVCGRGIAMLREAGAEVVTGVLEEECRALNARFITAHTQQRPFVALKFARTADGWLDDCSGEPLHISTRLTQVLMHRFRSLFDAVLVGSGTVTADRPQLSVRRWDGRSPRPVILDRRGRLTETDLAGMADRNPLVVGEYGTLESLLRLLYTEHGITSVMVEGGAGVLRSFVDERLWDIARQEVSPIVLGDRGRSKAPCIDDVPVRTVQADGNTINLYSRNRLFDPDLVL